MLALGHWEGHTNAIDPLALSTELEIVLGEDDAARKLVLGAFGIGVLGEAFESLSFSLLRNGVALDAPQLFDSEAAVLDYFAETVLDLGTGWNAGDALLARFELDLGADTTFALGIGFAMASVPEPGTAVLLALGLVTVALRRRLSA
jgi:hypothetical protein